MPGAGLLLLADGTTVAYDPFFKERPMDAMELPVTRYALSGDVSVAYQVMGDGPLDIILIPGFMSHIEFQHELAGWTAFLRHLSKFARVIPPPRRRRARFLAMLHRADWESAHGAHARSDRILRLA